MRANINEFVIGTGVAVILVVLCVSWTVRDVAAQLSDVTRDEALSVERCISNNTDASIDPLEEKELIRAGIIEEDLNKVTITKEQCEYILERSPRGTPLERAIAASNVIQELNIIRRSMRVTVEGDVNGDGVVNAEDPRIASASSYAASQAAQKVIRAAISEEEGRASTSEEISADLVSYLQDAAQEQYDNGGGEGGGRGGGGGTEEDNFVQKVPYRKAQQKGEAAARGKGASSKAAEAAGGCAAKLHVIGGAMPASIQAHLALDEPPKKMQWKDSDITKLRISPAVYETVEQLKQKFEETEEPTVSCVQATNQMKADLVGSAFDVEERNNPVQGMLRNAPTEWEWKVAASKGGRHELKLNLSYDLTPRQEDGFHDVIPVPLDTKINVEVTPWQRVANFVGTNWQWLWTAILVPVAIWLWGRYKRSQERREAEQA